MSRDRRVVLGAFSCAAIVWLASSAAAQDSAALEEGRILHELDRAQQAPPTHGAPEFSPEFEDGGSGQSVEVLIDPGPAVDPACEALVSLMLPDTFIEAAEVVEGAEPLHCRVVATIETEIGFEVWLPIEDWNGRFNGIGNGTYKGEINVAGMRAALSRGYATASTDGGHRSGGFQTTWALGSFERIENLGHRAHHLMTLRAKEIIEAYYGQRPEYSYFSGCSSGGWQGLTEIQRHPEDYDGVLAGAPALRVIHQHAGSIFTGFEAEALSAMKLETLSAAVIEACDRDDRVEDGLVEDPLRCRFEPASIRCEGADADDCLTDAEVAAAEAIYAGAVTSFGERIYPGWPRTSEAGWGLFVTDFVRAFAGGTFWHLAFQDPTWTVARIDEFDLDRDVAEADARIGDVFNAWDPDIRDFARRGGKLILWHGWSDPLIPATNTIAYYDEVVRANRGRMTLQRVVQRKRRTRRHQGLRETRRFARLFLLPGVGHCGGGAGPRQFDGLAALETWVEEGRPPTRIVARDPDDGKSRPLCPHPTVARYVGFGSTDDADRFACIDPEKEAWRLRRQRMGHGPKHRKPTWGRGISRRR